MHQRTSPLPKIMLKCPTARHEIHKCNITKNLKSSQVKSNRYDKQHQKPLVTISHTIHVKVAYHNLEESDKLVQIVHHNNNTAMSFLPPNTQRHTHHNHEPPQITPPMDARKMKLEPPRTITAKSISPPHAADKIHQKQDTL